MHKNYFWLQSILSKLWNELQFANVKIHSPKGELEGLNVSDISIDIILLLKLRRVMDLFRCWTDVTVPIGEISGDEMSLESDSGVP